MEGRLGRWLPAVLLIASCSRSGLEVSPAPRVEVDRSEDDGARVRDSEPPDVGDSSVPGPPGPPVPPVPPVPVDLCEPSTCAGDRGVCEPDTGACACPDACEPGIACTGGELAQCRGDADGCLDWELEAICDDGCFDGGRCTERDTLQWGTAGIDHGLGFGIDGGGGLYLTGHTARSFTGTPNAGPGDVFLTRLTADLSEDWSRQWGSGMHEQGSALAVDPGDPGEPGEPGDPVNRPGAVYVAGRTFGALGGQASAGGGDGFVIRVGLDGMLAWTRHLGTPGRDEARDVAVDTPGDGDETAIYVVGTTEGDLGGQPNRGGQCITGACPDGVMCTTRACTDAYVTRLRPDGSPAWTRVFGTVKNDAANAVTVAPDGGVIVAGHSGGDLDGVRNLGGPCAPEPCNDLFVTRFEPDGGRAWTRVWGSDDNDVAAAVTTDDAGTVYVGAMTGGDLAGDNLGRGDAVLTQLSPQGTIGWSRQWGSTEDEDLESVLVTAGGELVVVGQTHGNLDGRTDPPHHWDIFVTRFDADTGVPESTQWGSAPDDGGFRPPSGANAALQDADGNLLLFGYTLGDLDGNLNAGDDCQNLLGCADLFLATLAPR